MHGGDDKYNYTVIRFKYFKTVTIKCYDKVHCDKLKMYLIISRATTKIDC